MNEKQKQEIRSDFVKLAEKYKKPSKLNELRMTKELMTNLIPKYMKKYGSDEVGEILLEFKTELKEKRFLNENKEGINNETK